MDQRQEILAILEETVLHGALMLDEHDEDWFTKIDTENLVMSDGSACICGQLFMDKMGEWSNGFEWAIHNLDELRNSQGRTFGFAPHMMVYDDKYDRFWTEHGSNLSWEMLAMCWIEQIEKRKANAGLMA